MPLNNLLNAPFLPNIDPNNFPNMPPSLVGIAVARFVTASVLDAVKSLPSIR